MATRRASISPAEQQAGTRVTSKIIVSHRDEVVLVLAAAGSPAFAVYRCDQIGTPQIEYQESFDDADFARENYRIERRFDLVPNALYALTGRVATQPGIGKRLIQVLVNGTVRFSVFMPPPAEDPTDAQLLIGVA
jgi:hypothetical protein